MDARIFKQTYGNDEARRVAALAGTSYAYFQQMAMGNRRPSVELADRLVTASEGRLDFVAMLRAKRAQPGADFAVTARQVQAEDAAMTIPA